MMFPRAKDHLTKPLAPDMRILLLSCWLDCLTNSPNTQGVTIAFEFPVEVQRMFLLLKTYPF